MAKTILICGATGFIGRNLVEKFASQSNFKVIALSHVRPAYDFAGVEWRNADLRKPEECRTALEDVDIVIQAAATTSGSKDIVNHPAMHVTDNAVMNSYLFREAAERCEQLIFFSCSIMYPTSDTPLKEEDLDQNVPLNPRYFGAGYTKLYLERLCEFYAGQGRCKFTVARHSNIYGPYDKFDLEHSHVFGASITKVLTADQEVIVWGNGQEERDLLYVDDLVNFVEKALANQKEMFGLYNVGAGNLISVDNLVKQIISQSGKNLSVVYDPNGPTITTKLCLDCSKAEKELGWAPVVSLEEGISKTLKWWQKNDPLKAIN
ncbi:MAG: NAD-dependent epimerase/dehydratase family protein [Rhodospirillales bacterium]|nr:NAD-dependent epimerase/dehydratase family protein [Rhodospirillales bacterium]